MTITVARTFRTAIRCGEDFVTVEETVTMPMDATDDELEQAVQLGWRIFRAQRESCEMQLDDIRADHGMPPATATEAERRFFARYGAIVGGNGWTDVQRYCGTSPPKPTTVNGWMAIAKTIRDMWQARPAKAVDVSDEWNEIDSAPSVVARQKASAANS